VLLLSIYAHKYCAVFLCACKLYLNGVTLYIVFCNLLLFAQPGLLNISTVIYTALVYSSPLNYHIPYINMTPFSEHLSMNFPGNGSVYCRIYTFLQDVIKYFSQMIELICTLIRIEWKFYFFISLPAFAESRFKFLPIDEFEMVFHNSFFYLNIVEPRSFFLYLYHFVSYLRNLSVPHKIIKTVYFSETYKNIVFPHNSWICLELIFVSGVQ
jgi:hypothetical protein